MALTNYDEDQFGQENFPEETPPEPERKPGNRTFLTIIAILAILFLIGLVLLLGLGPNLLSRQAISQQETAAQINAANTATAMAATAAVNQHLTQVALTAIALTPTVGPTKTPVVVILANTPIPEGTTALSPAELATVSALQTQMASQGTPVAGVTPTTLPNSGFADDFGLPLMVGMALILVAIIILSRKLRLSSR